MVNELIFIFILGYALFLLYFVITVIIPVGCILISIKLMELGYEPPKFIKKILLYFIRKTVEKYTEEG